MAVLVDTTESAKKASGGGSEDEDQCRPHNFNEKVHN